MFQLKHSGEFFGGRPDKMLHNENVNIPPATHLIGDLEPHSLYAVRVACHSSQGPSDWSPWVELRTKEGGENEKMFVFSVRVGGSLPLKWAKVKAVLSGYWLRSRPQSPPTPSVTCGTGAMQQQAVENKKLGSVCPRDHIIGHEVPFALHICTLKPTLCSNCRVSYM